MTKKQKSANKTKTPIRPIDHIVLSVADLEVARMRFTALGFNVNPNARHDFGTQNCIIPFENGTFIEPLAIADSKLVEHHHQKRNPFLIRDRAFRFSHGGEKFDDGFSMFALAGTDVKKDRKAFRKAGFRTGKIATVKRPGLELQTSFIIDERAPHCTLFACERKKGAPKFDAETTQHSNGALRVSKVILNAELPHQFEQYLKTATGVDQASYYNSSMSIALPNGKISVLTPSALKSDYGFDMPACHLNNGLQLATWEVEVSALDQVAMLLAESGIDARQIGQRIVVSNAPGQGAPLTFIEGKKA